MGTYPCPYQKTCLWFNKERKGYNKGNCVYSYATNRVFGTGLYCNHPETVGKYPPTFITRYKGDIK